MFKQKDQSTLGEILVKSNLIQAHSLEIFFAALKFTPDNKFELIRIAEILEDIGNIYNNIAEQISSTYIESKPLFCAPIAKIETKLKRGHVDILYPDA